VRAHAGTVSLTVRTVALDGPLDLLGTLPDPHGYVWVHRGAGLVGWGEHLRIDVGAGEGRFDEAGDRLGMIFDQARVDDEVGDFGTGPVAFGAFTFDHARPGSAVVIPKVIVGQAGGRAWLTTVGRHDRPELRAQPGPAAPERIRYAGSSISEVAWLEAVNDAVAAIKGGRLRKVVLARDLQVWSKSELEPRALAQRLAQRFPECFTFFCDGLIGATPELLVRRRGSRVESTVLAGSAPRGATPQQDDRLGHSLLASVKDLDEHTPAREAVEEVLAALCSSLEIDPEPWLLRLANVQHLATGLRGTLTGRPSALEIAGRLHPTPAICGTPTSDARELIETLEGLDRARYSGPVGWVSAEGDGEWGIALRCAELAGDRARLFAGAGIVADSLPEDELEETRIKLQAMQSALEASPSLSKPAPR
jgi:menaquinone-specific isochorismate synthase